MTDNVLLLEEFFAPAEMAALWAFAMEPGGGLRRQRGHRCP